MFLCSPVMVAELWHGACPAEHKLLTTLFSALVCIPISGDTGRRAGDFLRHYAKRHYPMRDVEFF